MAALVFGLVVVAVVGWLAAYGAVVQAREDEARHEREIAAAADTIRIMRVKHDTTVSALVTYQDALRVMGTAFEHALNGDVESARAVWLEHYT